MVKYLDNVSYACKNNCLQPGHLLPDQRTVLYNGESALREVGNSLEVFDNRLVALEARIAQDGIIVQGSSDHNGAQKACWEAFGEIIAEHLGYFGHLDTHYVCRIKGAGKIFQ